MKIFLLLLSTIFIMGYAYSTADTRQQKFIDKLEREVLILPESLIINLKEKNFCLSFDIFLEESASTINIVDIYKIFIVLEDNGNYIEEQIIVGITEKGNTEILLVTYYDDICVFSFAAIGVEI